MITDGLLTSDGKLKDELHREYKRGGCSVRAVRIKTLANSLRVAIITFSDPADVAKALEDSRSKRIFGSLIEAEKLNNHHDERWDLFFLQMYDLILFYC